MRNALDIDVGIGPSRESLPIMVSVYGRLPMNDLVKWEPPVNFAELPDHPLLTASVQDLFAVLA